MVPMKVVADGSNEFAVFLYYFIAYCVFDMVYCLLDTPYAALAADMSHDYKERVYLSAFRMGLSQFSAILSTAVAPVLLLSFSYSSNAYALMAGVFTCLYSLVWIFVFFGTREIPPKVTKKHARRSIGVALGVSFKDFFSTFKHKTFRAHLGLFLCSFAALDVLMSFAAYFMKVYLGDPSLLSMVSAMWIAQLCILPLYVLVAKSYSMAVAFRIGAVIWLIAIISMITLTPDNASRLNVAFHFALIGIGLSPCYVVPMMMLSFVTEVDTLLTGKRRTGIYAGTMSFARKLSQGIFILPGLGFILTFAGYSSHAKVQTHDTVMLIHWVFIIVPMILIVCGFLFSLKFYVNRKNFHYIKDEVERLESGETSESTCDLTKELCAKVTGKSYHNLIARWRVDNARS